MNLSNLLTTCAAGLAVAGPLAFAGPGDKTAAKPTKKGATLSTMVNPFANPEQANWADNFDSYTVGQGIVGRGGWEFWPNSSIDGVVVTTQSSSPANSLELFPQSDIVQRFTITSGVWEFTIQTYFPSSAPGGDGIFLILLNQLVPVNPVNNWSMQIALNADLNEPFMIESQFDGAILPLILDQWVEFRAVIDLDNDTMNTFYGGTPLGVDLIWTQNVSGGGLPQISALDLYSGALFDPEMFLDDVALTEMGGCPCACDFDTSTMLGVCDLFDFLEFQNLFVGGDPCACDIDTSTMLGVCDLFDFLAFQNQFVAGCP